MTISVIEEGTGTIDLAAEGLAPRVNSCGYAFAIWNPDSGTRIRYCELKPGHHASDHKIEDHGRVYSRDGKHNKK